MRLVFFGLMGRPFSSCAENHRARTRDEHKVNAGGKFVLVHCHPFSKRGPYDPVP